MFELSPLVHIPPILISGILLELSPLVHIQFYFQESTDPIETQFLLSDQVYAKAKIPPTNKVCLWLGVSNMIFTFFCLNSCHHIAEILLKW
jgi:hypothetical protein